MNFTLENVCSLNQRVDWMSADEHASSSVVWLFFMTGRLCGGSEQAASHGDQGLQGQPGHQLRGVHSQSGRPVR